jgi:hypothetical protein
VLALVSDGTVFFVVLAEVDFFGIGRGAGTLEFELVFFFLEGAAISSSLTSIWVALIWDVLLRFLEGATISSSSLTSIWVALIGDVLLRFLLLVVIAEALCEVCERLGAA